MVDYEEWQTMDCGKIKEGEAETLLSFAPIYDKNSKILILGTMPSPASLKAGMYYSHQNNNFLENTRIIDQ